MICDNVCLMFFGRSTIGDRGGDGGREKGGGRRPPERVSGQGDLN
jgi:hypothetical protein